MLNILQSTNITKPRRSFPSESSIPTSTHLNGILCEIRLKFCTSFM